MAEKRKKKGPKPLTALQRSLIKNLTKGMSVSKAAQKAGYSPKNARQSGHQALGLIKLSMPELLDSKGLTDEALIDNYLRPGLNATETKLAQFEGQFTDSVDLVAYGTRRDYLDMTYKLKGSYAPVKQSIAAETGPVAIQIVTNFKFPDVKLRNA